MWKIHGEEWVGGSYWWGGDRRKGTTQSEGRVLRESAVMNRRRPRRSKELGRSIQTPPFWWSAFEILSGVIRTSGASPKAHRRAAGTRTKRGYPPNGSSRH